ncbi:hypothetical protein SteCoe_28423 [Stentor coeruleus]|uniref:Cyclic nucleotide-binding domain-containing protein n=1 Tax=Stentor coeruleus TaxID=5963 RepID=A0A1R2B8C7_9CILI|nr:hypothetical protein SteCoe_28423 [Stentor coeruleus]
MNKRSNTIRNTNEFSFYNETQIETIGNKPDENPIKNSYKEVWLRALKKIKLNRRIHHFTSLKKHNPFAVTDELIETICQNSELYNPHTEILSKCVIHPHGYFYLLWTLLISICLFYLATYGTYYIAFWEYNQDSVQMRIEIIIDIIFILDLFLTMNLAYYDKNNYFVAKKWKILLNSFFGWEILDLVSAVPFGIIMLFGSYERIPKIVFFRYMPKLLRLMKTIKKLRNFLFIRKIDYFVIIYGKTIHTIRIFFILSLFIHLVSCFFYISAKFDDFDIDTWVSRNHLNNATPSERYLASVYWAITTLATIGYGDIVPFTTTEKIIAILWMIMGVYVVSFSIGQFTILYSSQSIRDSLVNQMLIIVEDYSKSTFISSTVKKRLKLCVHNLSIINRTCKIEKILKDIPSDLKYEIAANIHNQAMLKIPFFTIKDKKFISTLAFMLDYVVVSAQKNLWTKNEFADGIFFIIEGRVKYIHDELLFFVYNEGQYFGDIEIFLKQERKFSAYSCNACKLFKITKHCLHMIKKIFSDFYNEIKTAVEKRCKNLIINLAEMIVVNLYYKGEILKMSHEYIEETASELYQNIFGKHKHKSNEEILNVFRDKLEVTQHALDSAIDMLKIVKINI